MDQTGDAELDWAAAQAREIGRRVGQRRKDLSLSAPDLAARCEALGMPSLTRQVIMRLEHGRREAVSVSELSVLGAALEISPILLLYPLGQSTQAEYLPGRKADAWDGVRWWSGQIAVGPKGDMSRGERELPTELFAAHHQMTGEWPASATKAAYQRTRRAGLRPGSIQPEDREAMFAVIGLREIRTQIRDAGLQPPQLPAGLGWIDERES